MTDPITLRFQGSLTAETSIATSPPDTAKRDKNDPAPLPKMTIGGVLRPYFPGGGLRGTLRRRAVDLVRSTLMSGGKSPFSLDDHYYLVLGGIKGDAKEDKADIVNAETRRQANPILGLFGAGDPWQQGRLYVSHAIPSVDTEVQAVRGARVDDFARSGDNLHILSEEERQRWLKIAKINAIKSDKMKEQKAAEVAVRSSKTSADEKKALNATIAKLDAEIEALGAESGYTNSINRPLDGYEVIPQGTELSQTLTLSFGNMMEVGLLMGTLRFWALDPWIGARKAHGSGVVSGHWNVSKRIGHGTAYEPVGSVTMTAFEGIDGPEELLAAEREFMDTLKLDAGKFNFHYRDRAA